MKRRTKRIIAAAASALAAALTVWTVITNVTVYTTHYTVQYENIPDGLNGFKIAVVSDFHNEDRWGISDRVLDMLSENRPDIIAVTGDIVDCNDTKVRVSLDFAEELAKIAPCYYVTGNHEGFLDEIQRSVLLNGLEQCGVTVLRDEAVTLEYNGAKFRITGLHDPKLSYAIDDISAAIGENERFTVLLSHRPEHYKDYREAGVQLVLAGHAHGGQFILPFIGGLYAPNQGLFPKYDYGVFQEGDYAMCVSRGIGNSVFPVRFNNAPELVMLTLSKK